MFNTSTGSVGQCGGDIFTDRICNVDNNFIINADLREVLGGFFDALPWNSEHDNLRILYL